MLDQGILEQLKSVFGALENKVSLIFDESDHDGQGELVEMLGDVARASTKVEVISSHHKSTTPRFTLAVNGEPVGITFRGIPGGHEFSSLILAILNSDLKGKLPDKNLIQRIKNLKGPIWVKTYVSLSCENCPTVVQALNLMAILHSDFKHEMIDGAYAEDEVKALGIQGVPSVIVNAKLVHSGKAELVDLLNALEKTYGTNASGESTTTDMGHYDVVVIGGGPAGGSAAIYSVRKGLKTAMLAEKIGGQMQFTKGIENFVSVPYTEGPQLSAQLADHISKYPIEVFEQRRVSHIVKGPETQIHLEGGECIWAKTVIVTSGAKWRELGIPGEKEYLGRGVAFCPHCDGPFYKQKRVAVVGGGNSGVEASIDLAGIASHVTLFEFQPQLKADQVLVDKLKSLPNVNIVTNAKTSAVVGDGQKVVALDYEDRASGENKKLDLDGVFVQIGLIPNSQFLKGVVDVNKFGEIVVDEKGRTSSPGIYAAGDVTTTPFKQIVVAMGEGAKAALTAFEDRLYQKEA